jgi:hypothetical protein
MRMREIDIQDYARQLLEAHGDRAVAEAAQKACAFEKEGRVEEAETWRHIEAALKLMRGPHVSESSSKGILAQVSVAAAERPRGEFALLRRDRDETVACNPM